MKKCNCFWCTDPIYEQARERAKAGDALVNELLNRACLAEAESDYYRWKWDSTHATNPQR